MKRVAHREDIDMGGAFDVRAARRDLSARGVDGCGERGEPFALKWALAVPLRDLLMLLTWVRGRTMLTVSWRGNVLRVKRKTKLVPV